jgi:hypothetical protein
VGRYRFTPHSPGPLKNSSDEMSSEIAEEIYVVEATKDGEIEYWAVALPVEEVLYAMAAATGTGWNYVITTEWLTVERAVELGLPLKPVRRIGPKL